jgi:hypothetical protein
MLIAQVVSGVVSDSPVNWSADWAWGLPIIVLTVIIHVLGLGLIGLKVISVSSRIYEHRHPAFVFVLIVGATTLFATSLHAGEASIWAAAYRLLGALPNSRSAMLYSLNAITSFGHAELNLKDRWQLLGALEALNGWLLFGLTTAFLFGTIEKLWALGNQRSRR